MTLRGFKSQKDIRDMQEAYNQCKPTRRDLWDANRYALRQMERDIAGRVDTSKVLYLPVGR